MSVAREVLEVIGRMRSQVKPHELDLQRRLSVGSILQINEKSRDAEHGQAHGLGFWGIKPLTTLQKRRRACNV